MYANSYSGHFSFTSSNLAYVESILLKTQARIYQAAQVCADNTVCKEYDITVCRKDIILLIARNAIQLIKKKIQLSNIYSSKILTLVFFGLVNKDSAKINSLQSIKLQVVKYFIFVLIQPALNAKKILHCVNCFTSHIEKIFCSISDLKSAQLIALDIKKYDDKNINTRKILSFLSIKLMLSECISIANDLQLVKMIIFAQVEWYLYINMQIRQIYKALHMVKQNNSCVLLSHIAYFDRLAHYLSSYLSTMNVNLKSVKCATYQYFGSTIYLNGICCTAVHKYNCYYEPSKQTVANLIRKLKSKLYHKNNKGYWRANTYIRPLKALLSMEKILQSWLAYYSSALSNQQVLKINRIADYVFYKWQTK